MGIEWDNILDIEKADIIYDGPAAHWEETLVAESTDMVDDRPADNDVLGQLENMTHDELVDAYIYCSNDLEAVEGRLGDAELFLKDAKQDIQTLMDILKEHGIQIPKDVEERFNDLVIWG